LILSLDWGHSNTKSSLKTVPTERKSLDCISPQKVSITSTAFAFIRSILSRSFRTLNALLEESPLHWVAGKRERALEVLARDGRLVAPEFKRAQCRMIERVGCEPFAASDRTNLFEPAFGAFVLCDGDRAIERDHRGRPDRNQPVVKRDDLSPVSLFGAGGGRVYCRNGCFQVIGG